MKRNAAILYLLNGYLSFRPAFFNFADRKSVIFPTGNFDFAYCVISFCLLRILISLTANYDFAYCEFQFRLLRIMILLTANFDFVGRKNCHFVDRKSVIVSVEFGRLNLSELQAEQL
jgi:hypothetical protein